MAHRVQTVLGTIRENAWLIGFALIGLLALGRAGYLVAFPSADQWEYSNFNAEVVSTGEPMVFTDLYIVEHGRGYTPKYLDAFKDGDTYAFDFGTWNDNFIPGQRYLVGVYSHSGKAELLYLSPTDIR